MKSINYILTGIHNFTKYQAEITKGSGINSFSQMMDQDLGHQLGTDK